jgi:non-lysosomal glucosylceramidase
MKMDSNCQDPNCGCGSAVRTDWNRRQFIKAASLGLAWIAGSRFPAMAGPFTREDFDRLVPADKKLQPDWVQSLTDRGQPAVYRDGDLEKIGMPIGGLFAGQLYFGGDGTLWHWDIFNQPISTGAEHYAKPLTPSFIVDQGFAIRMAGEGSRKFRRLDRSGWRDISFRGQYPIGAVTYRDPEVPVTVGLEAFSPFIPLNTDDSSLPVTLFEFTVHNESARPVDLEFTGWLENVTCLHSARNRAGLRHNQITRSRGMLCLGCSASEARPDGSSQIRPDIVFDDFEDPSYRKWSVQGTAFGEGPVELSKVPAYQGDLGGHGRRVVNSHASAPGQTVEQRDSATGKLTSHAFTIARHYIRFLIGGGSHKDRTCINLLIEDKVVRSVTGNNDNKMSPVSWDVRAWEGKAAKLEIVDEESGPWGNIGIDDIVFSDAPGPGNLPLNEEADFGTLALALLKPRRMDFACTEAPDQEAQVENHQPVSRSFDQKLVGSLTRRLSLAPGASEKISFALAWHMPNWRMNRLPPGRHYAARFDSAAAVAGYVAKNLMYLAASTRLWRDTWYDSTLPYWFLDRTFLNTSILATSTAQRFADGRFYAWEGVGCCEGTCGHVWQYAHAMARLFPELERMTREKVDFGLALQPDGAIHFRGEFNDFPAIDAQAGTILRALREHQMSADDKFLTRNWPAIKRATEWLIHKDGNGDGIIETNQHNTLDTDWFGPVAWLSGLYLAALAAAAALAREAGDGSFAEGCRQIFEAGQKNLTARLFDGDYFINHPDPAHLDAINSGTGCEIDQVFGQSWAFQVALPRVFPQRETVSALKSLWRFNFSPDVGPYRKRYSPGRWYAMPGEAGLLMCSFPRRDWDYPQAKGKGPDWAAGYFNECMNGFEYQAAGHMVWEGLITEGLAVTRAVHDRYHPSRRNPWNEVECGDHYARSMASYGVFLAACGFEYHGPHQHIGFDPRVFSSHQHDRFQCAFTSAEGWGSYSQTVTPETFQCRLTLKQGILRLRTIALNAPEGFSGAGAQVKLDGKKQAHRFDQDGPRILITCGHGVSLRANQELQIGVNRRS